MAYNNLYTQYGLQSNSGLDIPAFQNLLQQQFNSTNYQQQQQVPQQQQQQNALNQFVVQQQQQPQQQHFQAQHIFSSQQPTNSHQQAVQQNVAASQQPAGNNNMVTRRSTRSSARQDDVLHQQQQLQQQQQQQQQLLLQQQQLLQQQEVQRQQQEAQREQQAAVAAAAAAQQQQATQAAEAAKNKRSRGGKSTQNVTQQPMQISQPPLPVRASPAKAATQPAPAPVEVTLAAETTKSAATQPKTGSGRYRLTADPAALAQDMQMFPNRMVENILPPARQQSASTAIIKKRRSRAAGKKKKDGSDSDSDYTEEPPASEHSDASPQRTTQQKHGSYGYRCPKSNVGLKRDARPFYQLCFEYFTQVPCPAGFQMEKMSARGSKRVRINMQCNACQKRVFCDTTDASTLQSHLERYHYVLFLELKRKRYPDWMPPAGGADKLVDKNLSSLEVMEEHFDLDELKNDPPNNVRTLQAALGVDKVDGLVHRATCRSCHQSIFILNKRITMLKEHMQNNHAEAYIKWLYEGVTLRFNAAEAERLIGRLGVGDIFWAWCDPLPLTPYEQMEKNSVIGGSQPLPWAKYKCHACKEILFFHEGDGYRLANHFMRNHATEHAIGISEQVKINHLRTLLVAERSERKFFNSGWQQIFTLFYEGTTIREHDEKLMSGMIMYADVPDLIRKNPCYNTIRVRLLDLCQCRICGLVTNTFSLKNANYAQDHLMDDHPALQAYLAQWFSSCDPRLIVVQLERLLCEMQFPLADYADPVNDAKLGWAELLKKHFEIDEAAAAVASQRQLSGTSQSTHAADVDDNSVRGTVRCKLCENDIPWLKNSLFYLAAHLKLKHFREYMSTATAMLTRQKQHQIVLSVAGSRKQQQLGHKTEKDENGTADESNALARNKLAYEPPLSIGMADSFEAAWQFMESRLSSKIDDVAFDPVDTDQVRINLSDILCRFFDGLPRAGAQAATGGGVDQQSGMHAPPSSAAQLLQMRRAAAMANNNNNFLSNTLTCACTICAKSIVCESLAYANSILTRHLRFDHPTLCAELDIPPLDKGPNAGRIDADTRAVIRFARSEEKAVSAELSGSAAKLVECVKESGSDRYTWFDVLLRFFHQLQSTAFCVQKPTAQVAAATDTKIGELVGDSAVIPVFDADYANQYLKLECKLCDEKLFFTTCDRQNDIDLLQRHFIDNHIKLFDKLISIRRDHTKTLVVKQVIMRRQLKHDIIRSDESKLLVEGGVNDAIKQYLEGLLDSWATILWMFFKIDSEEVKFCTIKLVNDMPVPDSGSAAAARPLTEREVRNIAYENIDYSENTGTIEPNVNVDPSSKVICKMCPFSFKLHRHSPRANDKNLLNIRKHLWRNHNPLYKHLQHIVPFEMPLINSEYWHRRRVPGDEELHLSDTRVIRRKKGKLMHTASSSTLRQCATFFSDSESDSSEDERRKAPFRVSAVVPVGKEREVLASAAPLIRLFLHEHAKWKHVILDLFGFDSKCKVNASGPASSATIVAKNERFNFTRISNAKFLICSFCSRHVNVFSTGDAKEAKNHLTEFHNEFYNDLVRLKTHLEDELTDEKEKIKKLQESKAPASVEAGNLLHKDFALKVARLPMITNMCDIRLNLHEKDLLKTESFQAHITNMLRPDVMRRGDVAEAVRWFYTFEPALTPKELVPPPPPPPPPPVEVKKEPMETRKKSSKPKDVAQKTAAEVAAVADDGVKSADQPEKPAQNNSIDAEAVPAAAVSTATNSADVEIQPPPAPAPIDVADIFAQPAVVNVQQEASGVDVPSSSGMDAQPRAVVATSLADVIEQPPASVQIVEPAPPTSDLGLNPVHRTATCRVCEAVLEQCDSQNLVNHLQHNHFLFMEQVLRTIHDKVEKLVEREKLQKQQEAQKEYLRQVEEKKQLAENRRRMMEDIEKRRRNATAKQQPGSQKPTGLFSQPRPTPASQSKVSFNAVKNSSQPQPGRVSFGGFGTKPGGLFGTTNSSSQQRNSGGRGTVILLHGSKKDDKAIMTKRSHHKKNPAKLDDETDDAANARSDSPPVEWNITTRKKKIDFGRTEREWDSLLEEAEKDGYVKKNKTKKFMTGGEDVASSSQEAASDGVDAVDLVFGSSQNDEANVSLNTEGSAAATAEEDAPGKKSVDEPSRTDLARALDVLDDDADNDPDFGADDANGGGGGGRERRSDDDDSDYEGGRRSQRKRSKLQNTSLGGLGMTGGASSQTASASKAATAFKMQNELQRLLDDQKPRAKPKPKPIPGGKNVVLPTPPQSQQSQPKVSSFFGVSKAAPDVPSAAKSVQGFPQKVGKQIYVVSNPNKIITFGLSSQKLQPQSKKPVAVVPKNVNLTFGLARNGNQQPKNGIANSNLASRTMMIKPKPTGLKVHQKSVVVNSKTSGNKKATQRVKFNPKTTKPDADRGKRSSYFQPADDEFGNDGALRPAGGTSFSPPPAATPPSPDNDSAQDNDKPKWPIFDDDDDAYENRGDGFAEGDDEGGDDWTRKTVDDEAESAENAEEQLTSAKNALESDLIDEVNHKEPVANGRKRRGRPSGSAKKPPPKPAKKTKYNTFDEAVQRKAQQTTAASAAFDDYPLQYDVELTPSPIEHGAPNRSNKKVTPESTTEEADDDKERIRREIAPRMPQNSLNTKSKKTLKRSVVLVSYRCLPIDDDASGGENNKPADSITTLTLPVKSDDAFQTEGLIELRAVLEEEATPLDKIGRRYTVPVDALSAMERLYVLGFAMKSQTLANGFMLCNLVAEEDEQQSAAAAAQVETKQEIE